MKPHIKKLNGTWSVVNFQECWDNLVDSALDANDWCVQQNTLLWLAEIDTVVIRDETIPAREYSMHPIVKLIGC